MLSTSVAIPNTHYSHIYIWLNKYQTKNKLRYFCKYLIITSGNVGIKDSRNYKLMCRCEITSESWWSSRMQYVNRTPQRFCNCQNCFVLHQTYGTAN